ncbi:MAG: hypothetical protein LBP98_06455 [Tannerella sp.]|jgi:hypothetical protein|nr:hypothetical protein [Tannerella sp.]
MRSYTELLGKEASKADFNFRDFIQSLDERELYDFVEDVLTERTENMRFAFPPSKNISTHDIVFWDIVHLPTKVYQQTVGKCLDAIFLQAIDNKENPDSQAVIRNALGLTMAKQAGISAGCMKESLKKTSIDEETKLGLAFLLSKIEDKVPLSYWDREIDYVASPYLIPAYISAYADADPVKALEKLTLLPKQPESYSYFKSPITSALKNMLIEKRNYRDYVALRSRSDMPEWVKQEFDAVLKTSRFRENRVVEGIAACQKKEREVAEIRNTQTKVAAARLMPFQLLKK